MLSLRSVCLIRPPYFTPLAPPLGIALLKRVLTKSGFQVKCLDFNVDSTLWNLHHQYFKILRAENPDAAVEGHAKMWAFMKAHLLAVFQEVPESIARRVAAQVAPSYGMECSQRAGEALQLTGEEIKKALERLMHQHDFSNYDVVGTSTYSTSLAQSLFVLRTIKERTPQVRTVMGGGVFADDLALGSENLQSLIDTCPFIDHVIVGEGELALLDLLTGDGNKRVLTRSDLNERSLSINDVPVPNFDDFDMDSYFHLTIEGGRSCPFQCTFCSETTQWGAYRKKGPDLLVNHVGQLSTKYHNPNFFMADSLMNPYIQGFVSELLKDNVQVNYDGYLRPDALSADSRRVEAWARSGLYRARLGIETASPALLDMMNKKTQPEVISSSLSSLAEQGIRTTTYWIAGHPGETEKDVQVTKEFIREHKDLIYEAEVHPYWYYPYGQVASRLHAAISLYPEEVTEIIHFREWEIKDCDPPREERYRRLSEMSKFAKDLGIPNIYTMEERIDAERRWFALHPNAREVH